MMNYVLFDDAGWSDLLPLTFTRPACEIRIGILTIHEKWALRLKKDFSYKTEAYLAVKFSLHVNQRYSTLFINGRICPDEILVNEIKKLKLGQALYKGHTLLAYHGKAGEKLISKTKAVIINHPWDIFINNGKEIANDYTLLTKGRKTKLLSKSNHVIGKREIFLEKGAEAECVTFNTLSGPVYIGKDAVVMEGCLIRGGFALGEHSELKMGAKIYGPTTIGPHCKVGGEVNNSVIFGYSNKAHDGFLGNSVLGEWCNLGADTNNSNLKNNYGEVKAYNYTQQKMIGTGLQFCGLMMGDHSKAGINTMFNTGTVVGVNANIFGASFPPTHIPSFVWGGSEKMEKYEINKALEVAQRVMQRRNIPLTAADKKILKTISEE
ncbi:MAG TPA: GlmU family protein [Bacteroidia bacterium]|jgi:UDP-N-acetylglucosamine diphosphorylase/glucosamine-1-phosphate N-acetyltransferase|nr:GlmU family protein [Bacteroidia bacterium]